MFGAGMQITDGLTKRSVETMAVAKVTEITSSSTKSFEDAVRIGIARAHKTLDNIKSAWIQEQKLKIERGKITEYRVNMKVTFILKD
jgi:flavin-binding protein dodecin